MASKKHSTIAGLDYVPLPGTNPDLSFGVIRTQLPDAPASTAEGAVFKRLFPVKKPKDTSLPWTSPTCEKWDVLLPPGASDELRDPQQLCRAYDRQGYGIKDLIVITTLRYPEIDASPSLMRLHEGWELARSFAMQRLTRDLGLAVIPVLHVPARAGREGAPHVHLMALARNLLPSGFGRFAKPLATDAGRELMDRKWKDWRELYGGRPG